MDFDSQVKSGTASSHSRKSHLLQTEYTKQQKYLDKCGSYTAKAIGKEEALMRRQLSKLENDRRRIESEKLRPSLGSIRNTSDYSLGVQSSNESGPRSFHRVPLDGKESSTGSIRANLRNFERTQTRSRRQLIEDGAYVDLFSDDSPRHPDPKAARPNVEKADSCSKSSQSNVSKPKVMFQADHSVLPKIMDGKSYTRERRKSMPIDITVQNFSTPTNERGHASYDQLINFMQSLRHGQNQTDHSVKQRPSDQDRRHSYDHSHTMTPRSNMEDSNDHEDMNNILEAAIQTLSATDDSKFGSGPDLKKMSSQTLGKRSDALYPYLKGMDSATLRELEEILQQARHFKDRKEKESDTGLQTSVNRAQRKRLNHLEDLLFDISKDAHTKFNPREMLECGYLRLSKTNIDTLEEMLKEMGLEPGIHAHSDVSDYNLFDEIRKEKEAEEAKAKEEALTDRKVRGQHKISPRRQMHDNHGHSSHSQGHSNHSHGHNNRTQSHTSHDKGHHHPHDKLSHEDHGHHNPNDKGHGHHHPPDKSHDSHGHHHPNLGHDTHISSGKVHNSRHTDHTHNHQDIKHHSKETNHKNNNCMINQGHSYDQQGQGHTIVLQGQCDHYSTPIVT